MGDRPDLKKFSLGADGKGIEAIPRHPKGYSLGVTSFSSSSLLFSATLLQAN